MPGTLGNNAGKCSREISVLASWSKTCRDMKLKPQRMIVRKQMINKSTCPPPIAPFYNLKRKSDEFVTDGKGLKFRDIVCVKGQPLQSYSRLMSRSL